MNTISTFRHNGHRVRVILKYDKGVQEYRYFAYAGKIQVFNGDGLNSFRTQAQAESRAKSQLDSNFTDYPKLA